MRSYFALILITALSFTNGGSPYKGGSPLDTRLRTSGHYFIQNGRPFFWLGDTGWLLFTRLNREETERYLEDRRRKGFNVIQVMVLHSLDAVDAYGDSALIHKDVARPRTTEGNDYWSQVEYTIDRAAAKGIWIALVPVWGGNVKGGKVSETQAARYASFLAARFKAKPNIIWMNGGDIKGSDSSRVWNRIGTTLHAEDPDHLCCFHPRGRSSSSEWFHTQPWLDFNCVQSGHRSYAQDTSKGDPHYGEDNWRYIQADYNRTPVKPVLDAEPSYEGIPHGLHDIHQPRWTDADIRRYGYWSVFAGAAGYTYGNNSVMQMLRPTDKGSAYGAKAFWYDAINDPGAAQVQYLKQLILSRPCLERVPDQGLVANSGPQYDWLAATRGKDYAFVYTWTGRNIKLVMGRIEGAQVKAAWFNPRNGSTTPIGIYPNKGIITFDPPGKPASGNDWVLVVDKVP